MKTFKYFLNEESITSWNTFLKAIPELKKAVEILEILESDGKYKAYIVGGSVRDIIIGDKIPDDIDIATNMPIDEIEKKFSTFDIGKNKDFGIVVIKYKGSSIEVANFRRDGTYADGRHPDTVEIVSDFKDDAERRDFTINAMAVDKDGNIIDYFDGQKDIKDKVLKTVGDAHKRFSEDYLRMLRAIRFSSKMGFDIHPETKEAIKTHAHKIINISNERVFKELWKMADQEGHKFADAILELKNTGLLKHILPEVEKLEDYQHNEKHHPEGNPYAHTIEALRVNKLKNPIINLAILLHDIGKAETYKWREDKGHTFYGHAEKAIEIINTIADRLKMDNETRKFLLFATENHMKFHKILDMKPAKVIALLQDKNWEVLYAVGLADSKSRKHMFSEEEWGKVVSRIEEITNKFSGHMNYGNLKKIINGDYIMKVRNIKPSPEVGSVIKITLDWIINNNVDINDKTKIESFIRGVK